MPRAGELLLLQDLIENIPQAVFGGILIKVGADTFDWAPLRFYCKNLWWSVVGSRRSTAALQTKYAPRPTALSELFGSLSDRWS